MKNSNNISYHHPNALPRKQTFENLFQSNAKHNNNNDHNSFRFNTTTTTEPLPDQSLTTAAAAPLSKSPWSSNVVPDYYAHIGLRGSLVCETGHIYSLATSGDLLYTGSESKKIRVWKNQREFSSFKSSSGLVKAIVIAGDRVFSGHQDGKIRIWRGSPKNPAHHKEVGTMPTFKAKIKSSFKHSIKHLDAISCLALSEDKSMLYSGSWDKSFKVWRVSDSKCLETVRSAHDDAVNSIIAAFGGVVFTGSADGSVRVWKREIQGKGVKHSLHRVLLQQESAVTALAADEAAAFLYCGSSDGLVTFWERRGKSADLSIGDSHLQGHKLAVLCLATAGKLVLSGSADTNICVWRRDGRGVHTCLSVLVGHGGPVKCLAVEEEREPCVGGGNRLYVVYSGSIDKSVKIWRVTEAPPPPPPATADKQQMENCTAWEDFSNL